MFLKHNVKRSKILRICFFIAFLALFVFFNIYINTGRRLFDRFGQAYLNREIIPTFLGVMLLQHPNDMWIMQELIYEIKPDFVIELGTWKGGTALYLATILEKVNENGKVITVDIKSIYASDHLHEISAFVTSPEGKRKLAELEAKEAKAYDYNVWKEKVIFIEGDCQDPKVVDKIAQMVKGRKVLILSDTDEDTPHVLKNLKLYSPLVSVGSYIIQHDTYNPVTYKAVQLFLEENNNFRSDRTKEKFIISAVPSGFLKRIR